MTDLMKNGGFRWGEPDQAGLNPASGNFTPPKLLSAYRAVTLRDAGNSDLPDPSTTIMKLHVNLGHASAAQIKRVLVDAGGGTQSLVQHVDDVVAQCDVCKAFEKAPHIPTSGTASASMFNGRPKMDLLFSHDAIALRIMGVFSKYSILTRVRS